MPTKKKKKKPVQSVRKERPVLFADFADRWEDTILAVKKPATIHNMTCMLREMKRFFRGVALEDMTYQVVQPYFTNLVKMHQSPGTVIKKWRALSTVLAQAHREQLITHIPKPVLPRLNRPKQEWLRLEEIQGLLMCVRDPYYTLYFLCAETGARIGEVLALRVKSIDLDHKILKIEQSIYGGVLQEPKTESSKREIFISDYLCQRLQQIMHGLGPDDFLFRNSVGQPLDFSHAIQLLHHHLSRAGVDPCGFHAFRRSNITYCTRKLHIPEGILGYRVGHRSGGMTLGVYLQDMDGSDEPWRNAIAEMLLQDNSASLDPKSPAARRERMEKVREQILELTRLETLAGEESEPYDRV